MNGVERRKLFCSVLFHVMALACVVWSIYVLIDKITEEITSGELKWPFWTKLGVVAIGITGSLAFMYLQCKVYVLLCRKWRAYNRIITVKDAPEKVAQRRDAASSGSSGGGNSGGNGGSGGHVTINLPLTKPPSGPPGAVCSDSDLPVAENQLAGDRDRDVIGSDVVKDKQQQQHQGEEASEAGNSVIKQGAEKGDDVP